MVPYRALAGFFANAGEIVVFAADTPENMDRDAEINALMRLNRGVTDKEMLSRKDMWTTYILY